MDISVASLMEVYRHAKSFDEELMKRKPEGVHEVQWRVENDNPVESVIPVIDIEGRELMLVVNYQAPARVVSVMADDADGGILHTIDLRDPNAEEELSKYSFDDRDFGRHQKEFIQALRSWNRPN
jgi:hypothetical protein